MSILPPLARMLIRENQRKPIAGALLTIGRQSVPLTLENCLTLIDEEGVDPGAFLLEFDGDTVGAHEYHVTDRSFFSMFTDATVTALDVSAYEGAGIVQDLNEPLAPHLEGIADFIFDGSCLDNLFDPARALKSMSKMLRPGGRMFCFNHATPIQSAYLCFSPDWFWDFFEANGYARIDLFTCAFSSVVEEWSIYPWVPGTACPRGDFIVAVIAEKGRKSTDEKTPIQAHYRELHGAT